MKALVLKTEKTKPKPTIDPFRCDFCGRPGHSTETCWSKKRAEGLPVPTTSPAVPGRAVTPVICYSCGKEGHLARSCPGVKPEATREGGRKPKEKVLIARVEESKTSVDETGSFTSYMTKAVRGPKIDKDPTAIPVYMAGAKRKEEVDAEGDVYIEIEPPKRAKAKTKTKANA